MQNPATDFRRMIRELDRFQLPSSLMECFDIYREETAGATCRDFTPSQLSWFLDLVNRFRGSEDRKDSLLEVFDPGMYTANHPAWEAAPGTTIEMPALTSEVLAVAGADSEFTRTAHEDIQDFRNLAEFFADEEIVGLAGIARAALVDQNDLIREREKAIEYVALNSSSRLEELWAADDAPWVRAPSRRIHFEDMVVRRKAELLARASTRPAFEERDLACYTEEDIHAFALDVRQLFETGRAKHLAVCSRCRKQLESWTGLIEGLERAAASKDSGPDA